MKLEKYLKGYLLFYILFLVDLEVTVKHRHLEDWFGGESTKEQMEYLGRTLKDMWKTKLDKQFPGRQVIVELFEANEEYKITIYQENH